MITENSIVTGMNGQAYWLGAEIGKGGEGSVYAVQGTQLVAKIYLNVDPDHEDKLRYMVKHPICRVADQYGNLILNAAWPQDVIYDSNRKFVGYVMPRIENGLELFQVERGCSSETARRIFPNYTWRLNVLVARNLAASVNGLHKQGYVIGDMNCKNFLVNTDGSISLLDTDSLDMTDSDTGKHYKCCVGMEDYLPPELQGRNLRTEAARFTAQTDDFALAVHIFQLLMNNYHPFSGRQTVVKSSSSACGRMRQIAEGKCPYLHTYPDLTIPVGAPKLENIVPDYIIQCFRNTFDYNRANALSSSQRRTTAEQWTDAMRRLLQECDSPNGLVRCRKDPSHFYLQSMGECGICKANGTPVPPPPTPKKKLWPILVPLAALALFFVCMLTSPSEAHIASPAVISSSHVNESDDIDTLIAKGTTDIYRYQNGSYLEMYFGEGDLERCRIYRDKNGNAEYIFVAEYNNNGEMLSHVIYDGQGNVLRTDQYTYNRNGDLTEKCLYLGNGQLAEKTTWTYLTDGRDDTMERRDGDGTLLATGSSTYDANGLETYKRSDRDGSRTEFGYDPQGNCIGYTAYDSGGKMETRCEYQYDSSGRQSGSIWYNADGTVESRCTFSYDANGREISSEYYNETYKTSHTQINIYGPHDVNIGFRSEGDDYHSTYEHVRSIIGTSVKDFDFYYNEFFDSPSTSYGITTYDIMGNSQEYRSYDETGRLSSQSVYQWDKYGYMTGRVFTYYYDDGRRKVTTYDANGKEISSVTYDAAGNRINTP